MMVYSSRIAVGLMNLSDHLFLRWSKKQGREGGDVILQRY